MDGYICITRKAKVPEIYHFDEDFAGIPITKARVKAIRRIQGIPRKPWFTDVGAEIREYDGNGTDKVERIFRLTDDTFVCVRRDRLVDGRKYRTQVSKSLIHSDAYDGVTAFRVSAHTGDLGPSVGIDFLRKHYPFAVYWARTKTAKAEKEEPFYYNNWM